MANIGLPGLLLLGASPAHLTGAVAATLAPAPLPFQNLLLAVASLPV